MHIPQMNICVKLVCIGCYKSFSGKDFKHLIDNGIAYLFAASIKCQVQSLSVHFLKKQNEQEILILLNYCKPHIEGWCTSFVNVVI